MRNFPIRLLLTVEGGPKRDIHLSIRALRCGPSEPTFAASAKSGTRRTGSPRTLPPFAVAAVARAASARTCGAYVAATQPGSSNRSLNLLHFCQIQSEHSPHGAGTIEARIKADNVLMPQKLCQPLCSRRVNVLRCSGPRESGHSNGYGTGIPKPKFRCLPVPASRLNQCQSCGAAESLVVSRNLQ